MQHTTFPILFLLKATELKNHSRDTNNLVDFKDGEWLPGLLGFWALSIVQYSKNTKEHVSETESVSVLRWGSRRHLLWSIRKSEPQ
jgi:hypothetical protein